MLAMYIMYIYQKINYCVDIEPQKTRITFYLSTCWFVIFTITLAANLLPIMLNKNVVVKIHKLFSWPLNQKLFEIATFITCTGSLNSKSCKMNVSYIRNVQHIWPPSKSNNIIKLYLHCVLC